MKDYLDYDHTKKKGQQYCRQLYAMLCVRIHLHIDWLAQAVRHHYTDSREELMAFVKGMVMVKEIDSIEIADILRNAELPGKLPKNRAGNKLPRRCQLLETAS